MVFEIILAGKPHSHVPPRASRALRFDFLLRALCSYFLSRALIRRGCEQSHVEFVCFCGEWRSLQPVSKIRGSAPVAIHESCNDRLQGHPTDRFGKLSVRKTFNPLWFSQENCHLEISKYEKFNVRFFFRLLKMSFWLPKKRSPTIFRKAIRPKVFGKWTKEP